MGSTIVLSCNSRIRTYDKHSLMSIADGDEKLVIITAGCKASERMDKRNEAHRGKTCSNSSHVSLCYTAVKEPLGELFLECSASDTG